MPLFDTYKFHPSSLGLLMTEARAKGEVIGETTKAHLAECFVSHKYGRKKDITNKYIEKGLLAEEDSMDLYTLVKDKLFVKNTDVIENNFFVGTPDIITETEVIDLKTSWDIFTFHSVMVKPVNKMYYWQLQSYMDLTGKKEAKLVYCLVNTPFKLVEDEKRKLIYTMGIIDPDTDEAYLLAVKNIELNSNFDDIPMENKYIEFSFERDDNAIELAHERVKICREFLNELNG